MENRKIRPKFYAPELVALLKRDVKGYASAISVAEKGNTLFVAHRGLSGLHRENTVTSFSAAADEKNYFGIETDVHVTSDHKYVIIHDDNTKRVSNVNISVEGSSFDELRAVKLNVKNGEDTVEGTRIPTIEEYVNACKKGGKTCVLELKNHFEPNEVYEIVEAIEACGYSDKIIYISFDADNLISLRKKYPNASAQYLTTRYSAELLEFLKVNALDIDIYHRELNAKNVAALRSIGAKINCWTVDTLHDAQRLISLGVDFITTNILL